MFLIDRYTNIITTTELGSLLHVPNGCGETGAILKTRKFFVFSCLKTCEPQNLIISFILDKSWTMTATIVDGVNEQEYDEKIGKLKRYFN